MTEGTVYRIEVGVHMKGEKECIFTSDMAGYRYPSLSKYICGRKVNNNQQKTNDENSKVRLT
jgi:hypothetical protein